MLTADDDNAGYSGGLRNVRQGDNRPDRRAAEALDHLHIDRQRGLVHAGDHQRSVQEAEQCGANRCEAAGHQVTDREGHAVANHAAKRTDKGMRQEHRQDQRADRDHHQIEIVRHDALQTRLNKAQRQTRQQCRDNLRLVAHFGDGKQAEVPHLWRLLTK